MATCDAEALLASSTSFQGLGSLDLLRAQVQLLAEVLLALDPDADTTPETLMQLGACFCGLSNRELLIAQTQLLCEWYSSL